MHNTKPKTSKKKKKRLSIKRSNPEQANQNFMHSLKAGFAATCQVFIAKENNKDIPESAVAEMKSSFNSKKAPKAWKDVIKAMHQLAKSFEPQKKSGGFFKGTKKMPPKTPEELEAAAAQKASLSKAIKAPPH